MIDVSEIQSRNNKSGTEVSRVVEAMIEELIDNFKLNITVNKNYTIGYPGMEEQFKMDFCAIFHDFGDQQWLLKTTNSIRERIYGTEFFAQNIRIIDSKNSCIERIYVVVPDSISEAEHKNVKRYSKKINSETYKSFLTDVITISNLRELIFRKCMADTSQGVLSNIVGKDAEKRVVQLLNDKSNWKLWNNFEAHKHEVKSDTFPWFKTILSGIGFTENKDQINIIKAVDTIPMLDGGGLAKTDVSFSVSFSSNNIVTHNISIKKTSKERVSVHEGHVADLIRALQIDPCGDLAEALMVFQKYGSKKEIEKAGLSNLVDVLSNKLPEYNRALAEFAIFGVNSPRINNKTQVADCIFFMNSSDSKCFWLRNEYIDYYLRNFSSKGQFGTPFQWTYPSGKRGISIQLKGFTSK